MNNEDFVLNIEVDRAYRRIISDIIESCNGKIHSVKPTAFSPFDSISLYTTFRDKNYGLFCQYLLEKRIKNVSTLNSLYYYNPEEAKIQQEKAVSNIDNLINRLRKRK